jgi:hypothetical protein
MITLSTPTYDINGSVRLNVIPKNLYEASRRGSVTETLDGGVAVYDTGYAPADQTLQASIEAPTRDLLVQLRYLVAYYGQVNVACVAGFYRAVPSFTLDNNKLNLRLRITQRLDQ